MREHRVASRPGEHGFTLMEVLVVLVLMGLIAAVAIPQITRLMGSAKHKAARLQIETVVQGLQNYQIDVGDYPTDAQGIAALWEAPAGVADWNGPYVRRAKQLLDPWGHRLLYKVPGEKRPFDLRSLGADNKPGGTGDDADIIAD